MYKQFAAVGILFFVYVQLSEALRCYDCLDTDAAGSLLKNSDCKDPFMNNSKIVTCPMDKPHCGKFKIDVDEMKMTSRSCETPDGCDGIERKHCSLCTTDLCNSAFAVTAPPISFAVLFTCIFRLL